eukprot:401623-Pyramimonas_sp.AAC.1
MASVRGPWGGVADHQRRATTSPAATPRGRTRTALHASAGETESLSGAASMGHSNILWSLACGQCAFVRWETSPLL